MKKTGLNEYVYDFSVDFDAIAVNDILGIHKNLMKKKQYKMSGFITFFSCSVLSVNSLQCVSMNNQGCKRRSEIVNVNTNKPTFYPYSITINKCKGSCNPVDDLYTMCS